MSHYVRSAAVKIGSRAALCAALREKGYAPEVHDEAVALVGYSGRTGEATAHVVLRGVGAYRNDVGFLETADGFAFQADSSDTRGGRAFDAAWLGEVVQLAGVHADLETAASMGLVAERVEGDDGTIYVDVYEP